MEQYEITIESMIYNEFHKVWTGPFVTRNFVVEARSETEASTIANGYAHNFNNVNVERI